MELNKIELLAPAGKWDVLEKVIDSGADAVYLGGKGFNMRMLRPDFNFSEEEIKAAVKLLHDKNKKLYITVNSLYYDHEISKIRAYLAYLEQIGVDGLIVQDMGVAQIHREAGLTTPLHASVQMGIANLPAVKYLEERGFSRAILSKNLSAPEIEEIHHKADMEIEFFVHGDLCISHTGQCYLSSLLAGESANRGRCIKPCRWKYALNDKKHDHKHYLASNDLCLYPYLQDLIKAGVISFKIEGRMRDKEYLGHLVETYRKALDRIIDSPRDYTIDHNEMDKLKKHRIRNFTAGNLSGKTPNDYIDPSGEREPLLPGVPVVLSRLACKEQLADHREKKHLRIEELSVKVSGMKSAAGAVQSGADNLIIGMEHFRQMKDHWNIDNISDILAFGKQESVQVWLETPRIVTQKDIDHIHKTVLQFDPHNVDGIIVNDYGSLKLFKDKEFKVLGGPGLNMTNKAAACSGMEQGLERITASAEIDTDSLKSLLESEIKVELTVHGPLCALVTDYCWARTDPSAEHCSRQCLVPDYSLMDERGQSYQVRTDQNCRNYIFYPYDLCLFYDMERLAAKGLKNIRIDGQFYDSGLLARVTAIYKRAVERINHARAWSAEDYKTLIDLFPRGLSASFPEKKQLS